MRKTDDETAKQLAQILAVPCVVIYFGFIAMVMIATAKVVILFTNSLHF